MRVAIPDVTNDPVISTDNVTCGSIDISPGADLKVESPWTITVDD
jgi:hypothetical protein